MGARGGDGDCVTPGLDWVDVAVGVEDEPESWCQGKSVGVAAAMTAKTPPITPVITALTIAVFVADHSRLLRAPG